MLIHQDLRTLPIPLKAKHYLMHLRSTSQPLSYSIVQVVGVDGSCASQTFPAHVLPKQAASRGATLQLGLSASSLDSLCRAGKKARLPAQPGLVSI